MKVIIEFEGVAELLELLRYRLLPDTPVDDFHLDPHLKKISEEVLLSTISNRSPKRSVLRGDILEEIKELLENDDIRNLIDDQVTRYLSRLIIREKLLRVQLKDNFGTLILHLER